MLNYTSSSVRYHALHLVSWVRQSPVFSRALLTQILLRSILGPALGGALAQPSQSFPVLFPKGSLFDKYPFLLPNLVCTGILALGVLVGVLFLEETHVIKKHRRDIGIETGKWLLQHLNVKSKTTPVVRFTKGSLEDQDTLLEEDAPPGYRTTEGSPREPSSRLQSPTVIPTDLRFGHKKYTMHKPQGVRKAFTKQVVLNIVAFGLLAL